MWAVPTGVVGRLLGLVGLGGRGAFEWPGDPWDVRQVGGCAGQGGCPTLQQELPVVDDPCTSGRGAEQSPTGSGGVVLGHVRGIVDGDPSHGGDVPASALLTSRRHLSPRRGSVCARVCVRPKAQLGLAWRGSGTV